MGERDVDQSIGFGVTRNTYSACSKFSENTQTEKVVDRSGKPEERNSSNAQIIAEERRIFFLRERESEKSTGDLHTAVKTVPAHANLPSRSTSCTDGTAPVPSASCCSRRDMENAFAALHVNMELQRWNQQLGPSSA